MDHQSVRFNIRAQRDFITVLRKRVQEYFEQKKISRYGNWKMVVKTIFMINLYLVPFAVILFGNVTAWWANLILWLLMGLGMSGIGLSIMHDANHDAYSRNKYVNKFLGYIINLVGGSSVTWRLQHNVLHHTFTNVSGLDEDIRSPGGMMRFSPHEEKKGFYRFQFIYAWFLYGLMTISWFTTKDYAQMIRYRKKGLTKLMKRPFPVLFTRMVAAKIVYMFLFLALPLWIAPASWWITLIGFTAMHYLSGLILAMIFQPAHVVPETVYPMPDDSGNMENNWAVHQLLTTTNFAPKSQVFSWFVGGLNYQIEHHLFPNICHVHYKGISEIVKKTAHEFNLPYHSQPTFAAALINHGKLLYRLGH
jgi:linoleoyl-CoA desaturase